MNSTTPQTYSEQFVARGDELARLSQLLETALGGELSVCFVTGEAGSGKTALLAEFASRAAEADPDLVFAIGDCNAQAGAGDPFLPFRELLGMLTGDFNGKLTEGAITDRNARRLGKRIQTSARTVAEFGPALIDVFVPGSALAAQLGAHVARRLGWIRDADDQVGCAATASVTWERDQIFEQYTNVLRNMSEDQPLLLLVDDLHWADSGSVDLLFHLCRRLGKSRVFLVGAYRPADVAVGRSGVRHPMLQVTNEVKRYFGDVWINLDQTGEAAGRAVVDAMIDREPNILDGGFRQTLFARTQGHPLFTDELLRALRERGDLVLDQEDRWTQGAAIGWEALPPRVEGVIGERIGRLDVHMQEILAVAAVEGEDFTAETIAHVLEMDRREVTRTLSRTMDREHQLVGVRGVKQLNGDRLSLYRFRHNLFQTYLYENLDEIERVQLHEDVGHALARLYEAELDEVAGQLARHAELSGDGAAAIGYLQRAGDHAKRSYANEEARQHFETALLLLESFPGAKADSQSTGGLEAHLRERVGDVLALSGQHDLAQDAFGDVASLYGEADTLARARLARKTGDSLRGQNRWSDALEAYALAEAALGKEPPGSEAAEWHEFVELQMGVVWARYFLGQTDEISRLAEDLRPAVERHGTATQRGAMYNCLILAAFRRERYATTDETLAMAREAAEFATEAGDLRLLTATWFQLAFCHLWRDEFGDAERELQECLKLSERTGWRWHRILSHTYLSVLHRRLGNIDEAAEFTERAMGEAQPAKLSNYIGVVWANRAWLAWRKGDLETARSYGLQAVGQWDGLGAYPFQWTAHWPLTAAALQTGDLSEALEHARALIHLAQVKLPDDLATSLESAVRAWDAEDHSGAAADLERAVERATELGYL